ncbi:MAG: hypothetical protein KH050_03470 [Clostridiaceae bacterium]|nr:hypothetical protein [Clostridiaceae bacterium]
MARPKLRGCSKIVLPDGTIKDVRDFDGNLVMDPEEWAGYQQKIGQQISQTVCEILREHPERKAAFGMAPDEHEKVLTIADVFGR